MADKCDAVNGTFYLRNCYNTSYAEEHNITELALHALKKPPAEEYFTYAQARQMIQGLVLTFKFFSGTMFWAYRRVLRKLEQSSCHWLPACFVPGP